MFTSVISYLKFYASGSPPGSQSERTLLRVSCPCPFPAMREVMFVTRMEAQLGAGGLCGVFNRALQA